MKSKKIFATALVLALVLFFSPMAIAQAGKVFVLDVEYDKGSFKLNQIFVKSPVNLPGPVLRESPYKFDVVSFDGKVLYSSYFEVPTEIFLEPGIIILERVNVTLVSPYFLDAKEIRLLDASNKTLLSIDTDVFAAERPQPKQEFFPYETVIIIIIAVAAISILSFVILKRREEASAKLGKKWS